MGTEPHEYLGLVLDIYIGGQLRTISSISRVVLMFSSPDSVMILR